jgi:hypothetical protein
MRRRLGLALACSLALTRCYTASAWRQSQRMVRSGFDFEVFGPWVIVTGPGAVVLAGGNLLVGSVVPLHRGVDAREPEVKWFHSYAGEMLPVEQVAILCHRERATWITGIRPAQGGSWQSARHQKWHFPACIEALPGRYELEVHYFRRDTDEGGDESVSRQAESTEPSTAFWEAQAGRVYLLSVDFGDLGPAQGPPPQRHIPRSRDLGTTWWDLAESAWYVRIEEVADTAALAGPLLEQRRAWQRYQGGR